MASRSLGVLTLDMVVRLGGFTPAMAQAERGLAGFDKELEKMARQGAKLTSSLFNPLEKLAAKVTHFQRLLEHKTITPEFFDRAVAKATAEYNKGLPAVKAYQAQLKEGKALAESLLGPYDRLARAIQKFNDLAKAPPGGVGLPGAISPKTRDALIAREKERTATSLGFGPEPTALQTREASLKSLNQALKAGIIDADRYNVHFKKIQRTYQETSASGQAWTRLLKEGRALTIAMRDPQEQLNATLARYNGLLKTGAISQTTFNRAQAHAKAQLNGTKSSMLGLASVASRLGPLLATAAAAFSIRDFVQTRIQFESMQATFQAIGGSAREGGRQFKFASDLAKEFGLNLVATAGSYAKFLATSKESGFTTQQTQKVFSDFAKSTRILGLSAADQEGVFRALTQMMNKTRVTAEELRNQLAERLPGAIPILARSMGVTTQELSKMLEKGEVLAYNVLPAFGEAMLKAVGGNAAAANAAQTLGARLENLNTAYFEFKTAVVGGVRSPFSDLIVEATELLQLLSRKEVIEGFAQAFQTIITIVGPVVKLIGEVIALAYKLITMAGDLGATLDKAIFGRKFDSATEERLFGIGAQLDDLRHKRDLLLQSVSGKRELLGPQGLIELKKYEDAIDKLEPKVNKLRRAQLGIAPGGRNRQPTPTPPATAVDDNKEAENARKSILKQIQALEQQAALLDKNAAATMAYRIAFGDLKDEFASAGPGFERYKQILIDAAAALEQATAVKSIQDEITALRDQAATLNLTADQAFEYNLAHGDMAKKLKEAGTEQARLTKEWRKAREELRKAEDEKTIVEGMIEVQKELAEVMGRTGEAAKLATEKRFKDLREALQREIARGEGGGLAKLGQGVDVPVRVDTPNGVDTLIDQAQELRKGIDIPVRVDSGALEKANLITSKAKIEVTLGKDVKKQLEAAAEKVRGVYTVKIDERFYNIPKEIDGVRVKLDEAVTNANRLMAVGVKYPSFATKAQAYEHTPLPPLDPAVERSIRASSVATEELAQKFTVAAVEAKALNQELSVLSNVQPAGEWELTVDANGLETWARTAKRVKDEVETPVDIAFNESGMRPILDKAEKLSRGVDVLITADTSQAQKALEDFRKSVKDPAGFPIDLSRPRLPVPGTNDFQTEYTITEEIEGRWYNLPQIVEGVMVDVEAAVEDARRRIASGDPFTIPGFDTKDEAEKQAILRSEAIGAAMEVEKSLMDAVAASATRQTAAVQGVAASYVELGAAVQTTDVALRQSQLKQVEDLIRLEDFKAQAKQLQNEMDKVRIEFGRKEQTIDARVTTGILSEIGARKELIAIHHQEALKLQEIANKYKIIADESDIPELTEDVAELEIQIADLLTTTDEFAKVFADAFESNLATALEDLASGVSSLEDAAVAFLQGVNEEILRMASQEIASIIRDKVFGPGGAFGNILGSLGIPTSGGGGGTFGSGPVPGVPGAISLTSSLAGFDPRKAALPDLTAATTASTTMATALTTAGATAGTAITTAGTGVTTALTTAGTGSATALTTAGAGVASAITAAGAAAAAAIGAAAGAGGVASGIGGLAARGIGPPAAEGGLMIGPGTGTSDSIVARVSNREFIMPARVVEKPGVLQFLERMRKGLHIDLPKFAQGGLGKDKGRDPYPRALPAPARDVTRHEHAFPRALPAKPGPRPILPARVVTRHERALSPAVRVPPQIFRHPAASQADAGGFRVPAALRDKTREIIKDHTREIVKEHFSPVPVTNYVTRHEKVLPYGQKASTGLGEITFPEHPDLPVLALGKIVLAPAAADRVKAVPFLPDKGAVIGSGAGTRIHPLQGHVAAAMAPSMRSTGVSGSHLEHSSQILKYSSLVREHGNQLKRAADATSGSVSIVQNMDLRPGHQRDSVTQLRDSRIDRATSVKNAVERYKNSASEVFKDFRNTLNYESGTPRGEAGDRAGPQISPLDQFSRVIKDSRSLSLPIRVPLAKDRIREHFEVGKDLSLVARESHSTKSLQIVKDLSSLKDHIQVVKDSQVVKELASLVDRSSKVDRSSQVVKDLVDRSSRVENRSQVVKDLTRTDRSDSRVQVVKDLASLVDRSSRVDHSEVVKDHALQVKDFSSLVDRSSQVKDLSRVLKDSQIGTHSSVKDFASRVVKDQSFVKSEKDLRTMSIPLKEYLRFIPSKEYFKDRSREFYSQLPRYAQGGPIVGNGMPGSMSGTKLQNSFHKIFAEIFFKLYMKTGQFGEVAKRLGATYPWDFQSPGQSFDQRADAYARAMTKFELPGWPGSDQVGTPENPRDISNLGFPEGRWGNIVPPWMSPEQREQNRAIVGDLIEGFANRLGFEGTPQTPSAVPTPNAVPTPSAAPILGSGRGSSWWDDERLRGLGGFGGFGGGFGSGVGGGGAFGGLRAGMLGLLMRRAEGGALDVRSGGELLGPGTPISDSILLLGSTKEFMVRAQAAQQPGARAFLDAFNRGQISMGKIRTALEVKLPKPTIQVVKDRSSQIFKDRTYDHSERMANAILVAARGLPIRTPEATHRLLVQPAVAHDHSSQVVRDHSQIKELASWFVKDHSSQVVKDHSRSLRELASLVARDRSSQVVKGSRSSWPVYIPGQDTLSEQTRAHSSLSTSQDRERERVLREITRYIPGDRVQRTLRSFYTHGQASHRAFATALAMGPQMVGRNGPELVYGGPSGTAILPIEQLYAGRFQMGGVIPPNRFGLVGESGREMAMDGRLMQIAKASRANAGAPTINHINIGIDAPQGTVTRPTAEQLAATVARRLSAAARKSR